MVPVGVESIKVVAIGGAGGGEVGGFGGRVEDELSVSPGRTLYVDVGYKGPFFPASRAGGASSDVRTAPRVDGLSPDDRLIVAGAGGAGGEIGLTAEELGGEGGEAGDAVGREGEPGRRASGGGGGFCESTGGIHGGQGGAVA